MASDGYRSLSVKVAVVSVAVLSAALMIRIVGPSILRFAWSDLPKIYSSLVSWLTPPYLYFVINGIIISIAASSRFHKSGSDTDLTGSGSIPEIASPIAVAKQQEFVAPPPPAVILRQLEYIVPAAEVAKQPEYVVPAEYFSPTDVIKEREEEEDFIISRSSWMPQRKESTTEYSFLTADKPLVSSRLGRRKSIKASPEGGKPLGVAKPKRQDTLESTWKTITDGRPVPLTRHLKKSDTWETHGGTRPSRAEEDPVPSSRAVRKSETFNERKPPARSSPSGLSAAADRLRKEPSMGQDDLNRRVEAFIRKFNEEMKLQRQESFKHYTDMINRGSH